MNRTVDDLRDEVVGLVESDGIGSMMAREEAEAIVDALIEAVKTVERALRGELFIDMTTGLEVPDPAKAR